MLSGISKQKFYSEVADVAKYSNSEYTCIFQHLLCFPSTSGTARDVHWSGRKNEHAKQENSQRGR